MSDGKKYWRTWAAYGKRQIKINSGDVSWRQPCFYIAAKGAQCIDSCFSEGRYRYILRNGEYLPIEAPRDKYGDAVRRMEYYFDLGSMPELKREDVGRLVVKSLYTYEQMKHIACSGKVDGLRFNEQADRIEVLHYCGISFIMLFAMAAWQSNNYERAADMVFNNLLTIDFIHKTDAKKRFDEIFTAEQIFQNSLHSAVTASPKLGFLMNKRAAAAAGSMVSVLSRTLGNIMNRRNDMVKQMGGGVMKENIPEASRAVLAIIRSRFAELMTSHLAGSREVDNVLAQLKTLITYGVLNEMKNSPFKYEFADRIIHKHVHNVINQRPIVQIPDESSIYHTLTKKFRA